MKNKKTIVLVVIITVCILILVTLLKKDIWDVNSNDLKEEILSIEQETETVKLTDITPFEWDVAYSFDPYTPKETIYETIGYKWDRISETVNEGMNQIVFLKDGKVVCYVYGYPKNNGFGIFFTSGNRTEVTSATLLHADDHVNFQVRRSDEVVYLETD